MSGGIVAEMNRGTQVDDRLLGGIAGRRPGPTLMCFAGIHGNEPAGVHAVRRVLGALDGRRADVHGRLVALAGNIAALERGRRFIDRDLNRAWTRARILQLRSESVMDAAAEDREQMELLEEIEQVLDAADGPVYALDLHTTSGPGGIFSAFTDSLPHREFASHFPVPMIFGLEELVDGTLLNLLSEHGIVAVTVETGQHEEPAAVDRAEAALWIALVSAGLLPERLVPEVTEARKRLKRDVQHLPRALEMRQKRDVEDGDGFVMDPGYSNFQPVRAGQVVARDAEGPVAVAEGGRLLMPLYQEQGEDGFFLVREFSSFWMNVSLAMRRAGMSRLVPFLPGVSQIDGSSDEVVVDKRIARFYARQLMHLLGFRQLEDAGDKLIMRRRPFDEGRYLKQPPRPEPLEPEEAAEGPA